MKKFVDVIVPLPIANQYTYSLPQEMEEMVQIGCRVVVPFGKKKFYTAIVTNVHYAAPEGYETKDIAEVLDSSPVLLPKQYEFWQWLAEYYLCTLGDVYKAAIPSGMKLESETLVEYNPDFEATAPLPEKEQKILDLLSRDTEQCVTQLEKNSGLKNVLTVIKSLLDKEAIFVKEELKRNYKPRTEARVRLVNGEADEAYLQRLFNELSRAPKQLMILMKYVELSGWVARGYALKEVTKKELLEKSGGSAAVFNGLVEKKVFEVYHQEIGRLSRICNNNGDVYALIFGMWLYNNVNTGFILLGDNFNIGTGLARNARSIFSNIICPCRRAMQIGNRLQQLLINLIHIGSILSRNAASSAVCFIRILPKRTGLVKFAKQLRQHLLAAAMAANFPIRNHSNFIRQLHNALLMRNNQHTLLPLRAQSTEAIHQHRKAPKVNPRLRLIINRQL